MRSTLRVRIIRLGLFLSVAICVLWLAVDPTGSGAPLVEGRLLNAHGRLAFTTSISTSQGIIDCSHSSQQLCSSDGGRITVRMINADGSNQVDLPVSGGAITWSPNGTHLAVQDIPGVPRHPIVIVTADGSQVTQVTDDGFNLAWAPDNTRLVFESYGTDQRSSIYIMNVDGSGLRTLTNQGSNPVWSPDGTRLAFATCCDEPVRSIYIINSDGSGLIQVTNNIGGYPIWSPDGTQIAFGTAHGIYVMHSDGSQLSRLTEIGGDRLVWSPDGTQIAFLSVLGKNMLSEPVVIYVVNTNGTELTRLTSALGRATAPAWSPDGKRIAFGLNPWTISGDLIDTDSPDGTGIFVINADGSHLMRLTPKSVQINEEPVWSPDGTALAFTAAEGANRYNRPPLPAGVFVVYADGSAMARLADDGSSPVWMPE